MAGQNDGSVTNATVEWRPVVHVPTPPTSRHRRHCTNSLLFLCLCVWILLDLQMKWLNLYTIGELSFFFSFYCPRCAQSPTANTLLYKASFVFARLLRFCDYTLGGREEEEGLCGATAEPCLMTPNWALCALQAPSLFDLYATTTTTGGDITRKTNFFLLSFYVVWSRPHRFSSVGTWPSQNITHIIIIIFRSL